MECIEQTVSKTRKSPPFPAQGCRNQAKVGNDGTMWISLPNKTGKYTWKSYGGTAHKKALENLPPSKSSSQKKSGSKKVSGKKRLESLSVVELKQKAKERGKKGYSNKRKAELIALLRNGTKASTKKKTTGYTKKKGKAGQVLYYKNGKRVAKKNVPIKYQ